MRRILVLIIAAMRCSGPAGPAAGSRPPGRPLPAFVLDGMTFGYLPPGLGTTTDFVYRFQRVDFVARVWESRIPEGWTVDLDVDVMRAPRLTDGKALHDWFISYDQRPRRRRTTSPPGSMAIRAGAVRTRCSGWCTPAWRSRSS